MSVKDQEKDSFQNLLMRLWEDWEKNPWEEVEAVLRTYFGKKIATEIIENFDNGHTKGENDCSCEEGSDPCYFCGAKEYTDIAALVAREGLKTSQNKLLSEWSPEQIKQLEEQGWAVDKSIVTKDELHFIYKGDRKTP